MYKLASLVCGLIFGLGLTISNMINPNKILNFLDIFGHWDPTLLVVMAAALLISFPGYRLLTKRNKPRYAEAFILPTNNEIDKHLIIGSAIFGIGWGLSGYCPGPAVAALATFNWDPAIFFISLLLGSFIYSLIDRNKK